MIDMPFDDRLATQLEVWAKTSENVLAATRAEADVADLPFYGGFEEQTIALAQQLAVGIREGRFVVNEVLNLHADENLNLDRWVATARIEGSLRVAAAMFHVNGEGEYAQYVLSLQAALAQTMGATRAEPP